LKNREIAKVLGCSISTVSYHLNSGSKEKAAQRSKRRYIARPFVRNFYNFFDGSRTKPETVWDYSGDYVKRMRDKTRDFQRNLDGVYTKVFTYDEAMDKVGDNPTCYLSGRPIDLTQPRDLHFDHITPRSKGGDNSLENLGIVCRVANIAKNNLSVEELLQLCSDILVNNGYSVSKQGK
jgi:5-methylcytosine-specific restriction endonuclease McrA